MKISIQRQIFVSLILVVVLVTAIFSPYGIYSNIKATRNSIDERLKVAAFGVDELLPEGYHYKLLQNKISEREYAELQNKLIDYKEKVGISYLYCIIKTDGGDYYFSLDQTERPFTPYNYQDPDIEEVFKTKKIKISQGHDQHTDSVSRTVLVPFPMDDGRIYVIGADLNVSIVRPIIVSSLKDFCEHLLLGISFILIVLILFSKRITKPILKLSDFAKKLADSNFSEEVKLENSIKEKDLNTHEIQSLASNIELMRTRLADYIENLKKEVSARELVESEVKIAAQIQQSFLPEKSFKFEDLELFSFMKAARQAGGDLYDFFPMADGRFCFAIGDVSGKGISAALFMVRAISLIRAGSESFIDLKETVNFLNRKLCEGNDSCNFITFFIAAYNPKTSEVEFINCAHNPPCIRRSDGSVDFLKPKANSVLAVFEDANFEAEKFILNKGDTLICYTDGVTEAMDKNSKLFGDDRLLSAVKKFEEKDTLANQLNTITKDIENFVGDSEQSDDICILLLRKN